MYKQIIVFIVFCTVFLCRSYAQDVKVLGFYQQPMDLTAGTYPRYDLNNEACALIKVVVVSPDVVFEGNIVGNIEFKTNEYWVYVSNNTRQLKVKVSNALPLLVNFKDFNIAEVKSRLTYELLLKLDDADTGKRQMQKLTIKVNPLDAKVKIDGFDFPVANGIVTTLLPVGNHEVSVVNKDITKMEKITLFASSSKELVVDLNDESISGRVSMPYDTELSEEEVIYTNALKCLEKGDDNGAEKVALKAISKGYGVCYEILKTLLGLGYYDSNRLQYVEIKALVDKWEATEATEYYENKAKASMPSFGLG